MNGAEWYRKQVATDPSFRAKEAARNKEYKEKLKADPARWAAYLAKQRSRTRSRAGQHAKQRVADPIKYLLVDARRRAAAKGLEFSLRAEDIVIPERCPVLGIELRVGGAERECSPSLDRIDNRLGYTPSNVRVLSFRANRLKADATPDELRAILAYVEANEF